MFLFGNYLIRAIAVLAVLTGVSQAATYYVSPTGVARWPACTNIQAPCSATTALANAVAGDLVLFRGGIYEPGSTSNYEVPAMNPSNSGTNGQPITFQAYPNETAIIHDAEGGDAIGAFQRHYIIWDGFTLDRNLATGIGSSSIVRIELSSHITIRNCELIGRPHKDGTNGTLISIPNGSYIDIYNNKLHGMSADPNPIAHVENASAIWIFNANHINIYNNDIYDNNIGIAWKVNPNYIRVYRNHFYNNSRTAVKVHPQTPNNTDYFIYENVVRNSGSLVEATDAMANPYYNLKVYNNTVYNSGTSQAIGIGSNRYSHGNNEEIYNNIYYFEGGSSRFASYWTANLPDYVNFNLYFGSGAWHLNASGSASTTPYNLSNWRSITSLDLNSVTSNPLFINAGGSNPEDYKLSSNSPGIGSGRNNSNIGAYTSNELTIGYVAPQGSRTPPASVPVPGPETQSITLFEENFEDPNFSSRGWYDNTDLVLSTTENIPGSTSSAEFRFLAGATTPTSGGGIRKAFTETDTAYISYWVKYSENYTGSNRPYHPHEIMLLTNRNGAWDGLSDTFLTAYIEHNEGVPALSIQDSQNIDENNINVDLTSTTENRSAAGCNGTTANMGYSSIDCYTYGTGHRNNIVWKADNIYFQDTQGQFYKNDWHHIEAVFNMNSIVNGRAINDGDIQYYYDGELLINQSNIVFRTGQNPDMMFNQFIIAPWIGDGSPVEQTMWIDDLLVATSRPSSLTVVRPSAPTDLIAQ